MKGENDTLFDMTEYQADEKGRKKPETEAEKRLKEIRDMQERDFKNLQNKLNRGKPLTAAEAKRLEDYRKEYQARTTEGLPEYVVTSKEAVARHYGVTKRTIINWSHRDTPMPQLPNGYDLVAVGRWALKEGLIKDPGLIPGQENTAPAPSGDGDPVEGNGHERAYYETEIKRLDSELKAFKLQVAKGEYVLRGDVAAEWAARVKEVSRGMEFLANRLPPLIIGKTEDEMQMLISNEVWEIRDRFARTGRFCSSNQ
ncbi:MAG: hypothetical protein JRC68_06290 [Deltaproteobacteria bacterium]|nr:hypothetical protein [Deltaproteobacteria bacterium]